MRLARIMIITVIIRSRRRRARIRIIINTVRVTDALRDAVIMRQNSTDYFLLLHYADCNNNNNNNNNTSNIGTFHRAARQFVCLNVAIVERNLRGAIIQRDPSNGLIKCTRNTDTTINNVINEREYSSPNDPRDKIKAIKFLLLIKTDGLAVSWPIIKSEVEKTLVVGNMFTRERQQWKDYVTSGEYEFYHQTVNHHGNFFVEKLQIRILNVGCKQ